MEFCDHEPRLVKAQVAIAWQEACGSGDGGQVAGGRWQSPEPECRVFRIGNGLKKGR